MPLVNFKDVLSVAYKEKYAVGSFNVINLEFLEAIVEAAERKKSPVILSIAEVHFKFVNLENITPAIRYVADRSNVPIVLHLDHGETFDAVMRAIRAGFTSIMFDGSKLPYEENLQRTTEVVKMCHSIGVTVEAELGHIGGAEGGPGGATAAAEFYTKVDEAEDFVKKTNVDALAVAIGTAHGLYKGTPKLDFKRLSEINNALGIPLVLHGGTGLSVNDFRQSIQLGVAKINFFTGMAVAATEAVKEILKKDPEFYDFPKLLSAAKKAIMKIVEEQMDIFLSSNKCSPDNELCKVCMICGKVAQKNQYVCQPVKAVSCQSQETLKSSDEDLVKLVTEITLQILNKSNLK